MIQDIAPQKLYNNYLSSAKCLANDTVICFYDNKLMINSSSAKLCFPTKQELIASGVLAPAVCWQYLFSLGKQRFFLATSARIAEFGSWQYCSLKTIRVQWARPKELLYAAYTAYHLALWYQKNKFCGCCGNALMPAKLERALVCSKCGNTIYPRLNPAVIVGVTNGDKLLLTKYANRAMSYYALVAGFTEIGETVEECCAREVKEETGIEICNLRYYKSQPWGCAANVLLGFFADVTGSTAIKLDVDELKEGLWVERKDIVGQADDLSLTNEMMLAFKNGQEPG